MTTSLGHFQDAFVDALYDARAHHAVVASLVAQPGFSVYRNTVVKGCVDALHANFPTVERLVGTEWFRAAAARYVHQSPPTDTRLLHYGADFPAFLDAFEHAQQLPYLGNVARIDLAWTDVHTAADEPGFDVASIANLAPAVLGQMVFPLRSAVRWLWFPQQPVYTIWRCNREATDMPAELDWSGEGVLLTRPAGRVMWQRISAGGCVFLGACAASQTLDEAAHAALDAEPSLDFTQLLGNLITAGVFRSTTSSTQR
jgi:hypothetical protein